MQRQYREIGETDWMNCDEIGLSIAGNHRYTTPEQYLSRLND